MQQKLIFPETNVVDTTVRKLDISNFKSVCPDKVRPFLRYPGSKFNASKYIEPFWRDVPHEEYREPFLGSGAVFFKKPKSKFSWLNDIDKELMLLFNIVSNVITRNELIKMLSKVETNKDYFEKLKYSKPQNNIEKAFRYFVINRMAYSGIMKLPNWGFHPTKSVQPEKWASRLEQAGKKLENNVLLTSEHFEKVILKPSNNNVWIFVDPPYYKADQKRAYNHYFTTKDHLRLLEVLKTTTHKFCLTYDNCEEIKELYSWANIYEVEWMYHTANSNVTSRKKGKELIITNY